MSAIALLRINAMIYEFLPPLRDNQLIDLLYPFDENAIFMISTEGSRTQREFLSDVYSLASLLPQKKYAVNLCEERYGFLVSFCACLLNQTINLLPPNRQNNTLADLTADYPDAFYVVDHQRDAASLNGSLKTIAVTEALHTPPLNNPIALPKIPAQQIAALAFTSGSTGKPKPNPKPFGTLAGLARLLGADLLKDQAPVLVATVPSQHMYGLETTIFMALQTPAILHNQKPFFPVDVKHLLDQLKTPALLITTPTHLRALTQANLSMPKAYGLLSATAPLDKALARAAEQLFQSSLYEIYGCTEAGSMALRQSTLTDQWQLLTGFSFTQHQAPADAIAIDPTFAHVTIADAPHLPEAAQLQDVIDMQSDRQFLLKGRSADLINVGGKRASLANLTSHLLQIEGVIDGVVFMPEPHAANKECRPIALVISEREERDLLAEYAKLVDAVFIPRPLKKVDYLPRNATGKLTREALLHLWSQLNDANI